ncbi:MAG: selenate reductase, partial [Lachnospiraceae bacterium]|nr:selenate reductase [Lachnospiraceae bacterium]
MSDVMICMPFAKLMNWVLKEHDTKETVFGVRRSYRAKPGKAQELFGRKLETPIGPAAGPNSQMAQNIIAASYAGGR